MSIRPVSLSSACKTATGPLQAPSRPAASASARCRDRSSSLAPAQIQCLATSHSHASAASCRLDVSCSLSRNSSLGAAAFCSPKAVLHAALKLHVQPPTRSFPSCGAGPASRRSEAARAPSCWDSTHALAEAHGCHPAFSGRGCPACHSEGEVCCTSRRRGSACICVWRPFHFQIDLWPNQLGESEAGW